MTMIVEWIVENLSPAAMYLWFCDLGEMAITWMAGIEQIGIEG